METPKTPAGELTEKIMTAVDNNVVDIGDSLSLEQNVTDTYNKRYTAILAIITEHIQRELDWKTKLLENYRRAGEQLNEHARDVYSRQQATELVYSWQYQQGNSFACQMFEIIAKADHLNLDRMRLAWPNLVGAWEEWRKSDQKEWLKKHNFDESKA